MWNVLYKYKIKNIHLVGEAWLKSVLWLKSNTFSRIQKCESVKKNESVYSR
jgi:hypothetical protein